MTITKEQVLNNLEDVKKYVQEIENKKEARAMEQVFTAEDIAEETNRERERSDQDRKDLDEADEQEHERENRVEPGGSFTFLGLVAEEVPEDEFRAGDPENNDGPRAERNEGERDGAVEVGVVRANERRADVLKVPPMLALPPPHRADAGDETHPVVKQDEDEKCHEQRKRQWKSLLADDGFEEATKSFNQ